MHSHDSELVVAAHSSPLSECMTGSAKGNSLLDRCGSNCLGNLFLRTCAVCWNCEEDCPDLLLVIFAIHGGLGLWQVPTLNGVAYA